MNLPDPQRSTATVAQPDRQPDPRERCILVVDDNRQVVRAACGLFQKGGYRVITATHGEEALEKAFEEYPDLVLLDIVMPDIDGFEVCRRLRSDPETHDIPIVMVTALSDEQSRLKGLECGADDVITKPFRSSELYAKVRNILRLDRFRRARQRDAQLQRMLQAMPGPVAITNTVGTVLAVNGKFCRLMEIDHPGDAMRTHLLNWIVGLSDTELKAIFLDRISSLRCEAFARPGAGNGAARPRDARALPLDIQCASIDWEGDPGVAWFLMPRKLGTKKEEEHSGAPLNGQANGSNGKGAKPSEQDREWLEQTLRARDNLLANLRHELSAHLEAMLDTARVLEDGRLGDVSDKQRRGLQKIETKSRHLLTLLSDIQQVLPKE